MKIVISNFLVVFEGVLHGYYWSGSIYVEWLILLENLTVLIL